MTIVGHLRSTEARLFLYLWNCASFRCFSRFKCGETGLGRTSRWTVVSINFGGELLSVNMDEATITHELFSTLATYPGDDQLKLIVIISNVWGTSMSKLSTSRAWKESWQSGGGSDYGKLGRHKRNSQYRAICRRFCAAIVFGSVKVLVRMWTAH